MSIKPRCGTAARSPCSGILPRIASHCVERLREKHKYCKLCFSNQIKVFHNSIHLVGVGVCMHRNVRVRTDLGFGVEMWPAGPGRMVRQWSDGYMPYVGGRASERAARTNHRRGIQRNFAGILKFCGHLDFHFILPLNY